MLFENAEDGNLACSLLSCLPLRLSPK